MGLFWQEKMLEAGIAANLENISSFKSQVEEEEKIDLLSFDPAQFTQANQAFIDAMKHAH